MKIILLAGAALFLALTGYTQTAIQYEEVIDQPNTTSADLFARARKWFSESFSDSKSVLDVSDKESGELIGNYTIPYFSSITWGRDCTKGFIRAKISISVKDGKYRYTIKDFTHEATPSCAMSFGTLTSDKECPVDIKNQSKKWENKVWAELQQDANGEAQKVVASLKAAMAKSSGNDW